MPKHLTIAVTDVFLEQWPFSRFIVAGTHIEPAPEHVLLHGPVTPLGEIEIAFNVSDLSNDLVYEVVRHVEESVARRIRPIISVQHFG